ncbi:unnamed protein product [Chrysodeixis includens]|uniref:Uncharacterized protein n=1 Tax=Chrysodeixis includens TaxID=689277 RepID=A0A9P0BLR8_CHRIL|nr:unnamed protein product [Chrysodeixis includens]
MPESKSQNLHTKSYTTVFDAFGGTSYDNMLLLNTDRSKRERLVFHGDSVNPSLECDYPEPKSLVTSERYNHLNNVVNSSCKTIVPSTSTIFYDLDDIAKRHSFHCLTEVSMSAAKILKAPKMPKHSAFRTKSIVQECATQIHPKLLPRDSREINAKKVKKRYSNDALSSEIFLRDDEYIRDYQKKYNEYYKDMTDRQQKFWSYAKYRTEYTKPIPEEKRTKKKDKGKRIEDPCPCQLFSYACPCTDKKSLTELARNSKSLTVADQVTSTMRILIDEIKDKKSSKSKKNKGEPVKEDKPTNTSAVEMIEVTIPKDDPPIEIANKRDVPILVDHKNNKQHKGRKKSRRILCPKCKEKVDVIINTSSTEDDDPLKCENSSIYRSKEIPSTAAYAYRASPNSLRSKTMEEDLCLHEPRCEMLPVCQILPSDNYYNANSNSVKKRTAPKSSPRIIRITKACRHHPPCTVVPSCQRANVLKNNCEYIPPCLHRPRCVNLPLCVPFSKSLHYEEASSKLVDDMENSDCPHIPRCKYVPVCQHDSLTNTMEHHQINMVTRVQNGCEFLNDYSPQAYLLNPKTTCLANPFSPCQLSSTPCYTDPRICRTNKSCQFDSSHCKCTNEAKDEPSIETVIFIRDVGCQFRSKGYSPKNYVLQSKISSNSFDYVDVKMGNYYANGHTLRYEDKFTSPPSVEEHSFSTASVTSELDSECPSHGRRANQFLKHRPATGFIPKSAYVAAFSTRTECGTAVPKYVKTKSDIPEVREIRDCRSAFPVKSRTSFLKGKYRKIFSVKRRRKSRINNHVLNTRSKEIVCENNK